MNLLNYVPIAAVLIQVPWFVWLSIVRVRLGGTSALPMVKLVDWMIPLPVFAGLLVAVALLWHTGGHGSIPVWSGGLICAGICAVFVKLLLAA